MRIDIPQSEHQRLAQHAIEAGFTDVQRYVREHVLALAHQPSVAEFPPLGSDELKASLDMIDHSMAEIDAGGGMSMEEARQLSLKRLQQLTQ